MKAKRLFKSLNPQTKCYNISTITISKENLRTNNDHKQECKEPWFKCRYTVTLIAFTFYLLFSGYRTNLSVTIVAMVNNSALTKDTTNISDSCPVEFMNIQNETVSNEDIYTEAGEFVWSPRLQGYIQGSYYLVYLLAQIPYGKLVERFGAKWFDFGATFVVGIATILIPVAARIHPYAVILLQIVRGAGHGVYQSSVSLLAANWFPKSERGLLYSFIQSGAPMGNFLFSIVSGLICKSSFIGGWPSSFYFAGLAGVIFSVFVAYFLHESPSTHPRISEAELKYILSDQENSLSQRRPNTPWRQMLSSIPLYALAIGYFGQLWAISRFQIVHSTFLGTILHYPIDENGYLSAVPFLLMFLGTQMSGWLSTFMTTRKYASVDQARKSCNFIASLGICLCVLGMYFAGCNKWLSSTFTILLLGFTGIGCSGVWIVSTDMSPTFAASVNAFSCTLGGLSSFIIPLVVGYLTNENQTLEQWNKVFFIDIGVVLTCGMIFTLFGSAKIQPWNFVEEDKKIEENKNGRS